MFAKKSFVCIPKIQLIKQIRPYDIKKVFVSLHFLCKKWKKISLAFAFNSVKSKRYSLVSILKIVFPKDIKIKDLLYITEHSLIIITRYEDAVYCYKFSVNYWRIYCFIWIALINQWKIICCSNVFLLNFPFKCTRSCHAHSPIGPYAHPSKLAS